MDALLAFVRFEVIALVGGLAVVVGFQMLTGRINVRRMFADKGGSGGYSPMRLQLLVSTLAGLALYVTRVAQTADFTSLPEVPVELVAVLGGSNLAYLGGKYYSLLRRR